MSKYSLIDLPMYVRPEMYEVNISAITSSLMNHGKILSVYRIGSVTAPGISDLDMFVVFKDGVKTNHDPFHKLDEVGKYLFVHKLFGASLEHFHQALSVTKFHNYRLVGGEETRISNELLPANERLLKTQTALEFLIKMYMVMNIQQKYKIIKVRAFLLEARALEYDLEFLGVTQGPLFDSVKEIIELRKQWFLTRNNTEKIEAIFNTLFTHLSTFLAEILTREVFYTSHILNGRFASNVRWTNANSLSISKFGFPMPSFIAGMFKKNYFKVLNKVNSFSMKLPVNENPPEFLGDRFALFKTMNEYNKIHIPNFMPPGTSLKIM